MDADGVGRLFGEDDDTSRRSASAGVAECFSVSIR